MTEAIVQPYQLDRALDAIAEATARTPGAVRLDGTVVREAVEARLDVGPVVTGALTPLLASIRSLWANMGARTDQAVDQLHTLRTSPVTVDRNGSRSVMAQVDAASERIATEIRAVATDAAAGIEADAVTLRTLTDQVCLLVAGAAFARPDLGNPAAVEVALASLRTEFRQTLDPVGDTDVARAALDLCRRHAARGNDLAVALIGEDWVEEYLAARKVPADVFSEPVIRVIADAYPTGPRRDTLQLLALMAPGTGHNIATGTVTATLADGTATACTWAGHVAATLRRTSPRAIIGAAVPNPASAPIRRQAPAGTPLPGTSSVPFRP